jgi:hypothetical protein
VVKQVPLDDFRAVRYMLEPEDFALGPDIEFPPEDLIDREIWHNLMDLPDDVLIRTTNDNGRIIKQLYKLTQEWSEAIGEENDYLSDVMVETIDEFDAAIFNLLHGFYRQAIGTLRNALELITIGAYLQVNKKTSESEQWNTGKIEIPFGNACSGLSSSIAIKPLNTYLHATLGESLFDQKTPTKTGGWARRLYSELSNYSHSKPTYANADMWASNGPIYQRKTFQMTTNLIIQTFAFCFILVKIYRPAYSLPETCKQLYQSGEFPWMNIALHTYDYLLHQ